MTLKEMHPLLPAATAAEYGHRAGVGLERHGHLPGAALSTLVEEEEGRAVLRWLSPPREDQLQLDEHRITEDSAEAIALALVHTANRWSVRRRLQRGESADWLLQDPEARPVALEVSGIGRGEDPGRLREKLEQVAKSKVAPKRAACLVELPTPRATVATVQSG